DSGGSAGGSSALGLPLRGRGFFVFCSASVSAVSATSGDSAGSAGSVGSVTGTAIGTSKTPSANSVPASSITGTAACGGGGSPVADSPTGTGCSGTGGADSVVAGAAAVVITSAVFASTIPAPKSSSSAGAGTGAGLGDSRRGSGRRLTGAG